MPRKLAKVVEKSQSTRQQAVGARERARQAVDKARNIAQVTAYRRALARLDAKKKAKGR